LKAPTPFGNYNITWMLNGNPISGAPNKPEYIAAGPGTYTAQLSLKLNPATNCVAEAQVNAKPCNNYSEVACGAPVDVHLPDIQAAGVSLAPGDKFTAGDYTVVITEISSGDPSGYIGTGYVEMRLIAEIVAQKIAVDFTNLVVNTCYEMASGDVVTQYDPNWGGILDVDQTIEDVKNAIADIKTLFISLYDDVEVLDCSAESISKINNSIGGLDTFKNNFGDLFDVTPELKSTYQSSLTAISASLTCKIQQACPSNNGRVSALISNCDFEANKNLFESLLPGFETLTPIENIKNIILFVNGYRGPQTEITGFTDNQVVTNDRHEYWGGISTSFNNRRGSDYSFFADGSLGISTSNHLTVPNFATSMATSLANKFSNSSGSEILSILGGSFWISAPVYGVLVAKLIQCKTTGCPVNLNKRQKNNGFKERVDAGRIAAADFTNDLAALRLNNTKLKFNIDIVAHSMGFAYAQGIIDEITKSSNFISKYITITGYYIIAAENACGGTLKNSVLGKAQVWQYGSNLGQRNADPMYEQDGVAPQCAVNGLDASKRVFIPEKYADGTKIPKNFLDSHSIGNYKWIF
jgi:hypothetical protein